MSRFTDKRAKSTKTTALPLPVIDWASIGAEAPTPIDLGNPSPDAPLPEADVVVITWTSAEWSAFDHVFFDSQTPRNSGDYSFEKKWFQYSHNAPPGSTSGQYPLWGQYQMVSMPGRDNIPMRVILFHSNVHLAYSPYCAGLQAMITQIISDTGCKYIFSIGTAGGDNMDQYLGDTAITNAGYVDMQLPQNVNNPLNHQTITGAWFPDSDWYIKANTLAFPMKQVCTWPELEVLLTQLKTKTGVPPTITLADLVNDPINPDKLDWPQFQLMPEIPLKTTDFYYIAADGDSDSQYAVLEMDDAIIAAVAQEAGVSFAFVRNISDPVVRWTDASGQPLASTIRDDWSSLIYSQFGFYTSFNGALAAWAAVSGI